MTHVADAGGGSQHGLDHVGRDGVELGVLAMRGRAGDPRRLVRRVLVKWFAYTMGFILGFYWDLDWDYILGFILGFRLGLYIGIYIGI